MREEYSPKLARALDFEGVNYEFTSLEEVRSIVHTVPYQTDSTNYGASDYWARPDQFFNNGGDCEDYAIASYALITGSKLYSKSAIKFVLVYDKETREDHMILLVDRYVLDNRFKRVLSVDSFELKRYKIQGVVNDES